MTRALPLAASLLWLLACANGTEVLGPWDASYQAVCVDSTATVPDKLCADPGIVIVLEIENPNYRRTPPDSVAP